MDPKLHHLHCNCSQCSLTVSGGGSWFRVSYSEGGREGYSPPPPPPLNVRPTCYNISATSLLEPQKPPEATSEGLNFKHFLGEHTSRPPPRAVIDFPLPNKISCMKPCGAYSKCVQVPTSTCSNILVYNISKVHSCTILQ